MNVYGELNSAQLENRTDPGSASLVGRVYWNTTEARAKYSDGTLLRAFLANDQRCVIGNNATAANNVRFNRGAAATLELLTADATTAEGTSDSSKWAIFNAKLGGAQVHTGLDFLEITTPNAPAANNRRLYTTSTGGLWIRNSAASDFLVAPSGITGLVTGDLSYASGTNVVSKLAIGTAANQVLRPVGGIPAWATFAYAVLTKTANYALTQADEIIFVNPNGGSFTLTLPAASASSGKGFFIKNISTSTPGTAASRNTVTIARAGADTIDLVAINYNLAFRNQHIFIYSDGVSNWNIASRYTPGISALIYRTLAQSIPASFVWTQVVFNTVDTSEDSGSGINTGTGAYTIPVSGWYQIHAIVGIDTATSVERGIRILKNGTVIATTSGSDGWLLAKRCTQSIGTLSRCAVGDVITVETAQNDAGANNTITGKSACQMSLFMTSEINQ